MSAPVAVAVWRDLPGARKVPAGILAVLVAGQYAGAIARDGQVWRAACQSRALAPARESSHPSADAALSAVLRSGFARRLGARADSAVYWTPGARRVSMRSPRTCPARTRAGAR